MTISDIADYCVVKDCTVLLGDPAVGFITVDSGGYKWRRNYGRFLFLNELSALPSPPAVLDKAMTFTIDRGGEQTTMTRAEFESELSSFRARVGV